ncbi:MULTISPECIES: hypothetical protein [Lelliottia]|uniref:Uncharacterized protein n=1 Tax=Lelliottia wanjuensis TaxID=3050585 RepID=A0AAP4D2C5_9ENTR|nr:MULTISPECIES: hypothetical protein [unclassified Lelliottia]MDK9357377.1 hypothetical protein [Lelliottia sp. V106_16]MDK9362252.1 hypothetical protein [Lelliottia sp. V106_12]MDK9373131.1 hypothetical protein [Lelliottia sp. V106_10]MDK9586551.1 hypothetical protein [Lelliottia sp. V86_10]MDK9599935.1 hypothetical protein [Lelliottia sp. V106_5]
MAEMFYAAIRAVMIVFGGDVDASVWWTIGKWIGGIILFIVLLVIAIIAVLIVYRIIRFPFERMKENRRLMEAMHRELVEIRKQKKL